MGTYVYLLYIYDKKVLRLSLKNNVVFGSEVRALDFT